MCELYQQDQKKKQRKPLSTRSYPAKDFDTELPRGAQIVEFTKVGCAATLPSNVQKWAGLYEEDGEFRDDESVVMKDGHICYGLAELNDSGASFKFIADVIESRAEML